MSTSSRVSTVWIRALVLCEDVRFELGGTMTLVGVLADRLVVGGDDGELVIPRLAIYSVVAGLTDATELSWRHVLSAEGREPGELIAHGAERHDGAFDEHRVVNLVSPLVLPGPGRYRLASEFETARARRSIDYHLVIERAPPPG